jgi:hypothetical protein
MAYTINTTNGTELVTVNDGTINTDYNVTIVGKNYANYGELLGENFIKLLENGADSSQPTSPLTGQLWFDTTEGLLKVYNGSTFKNLGAATASATAPSSAVTGDMWFDSDNTQLNVYDGSGWVVVGPAYTSGSGVSGSIVDTITDTLAVDHVVFKMMVENVIVGMVSKDAEFTPASSISGFATVKPGLQLSTTVTDALFQGTASDSEALGGTAASGFVQNSGSTQTMSVGLSILNDADGLEVGAGADFKVTVSGTDATVANVSQDGDIYFTVNDGGVTKTLLTLNGANGAVTVNADPTANLGVATKQYVDAALSTTGDVLYRDGTNNITGVITPDGNGTRDLGSSSAKFAVIYANEFNGTATTAEYADLAERFEADAEYEAGTVVELGGVAEVTQAVEELSEDVFGVISDRAAYLMNSAAGSNATHPPIAMNGRVPVKVVGTVNKGDRLVSAGNGFARAAKDGEATARNIIGRALQTKTTEEAGTVEAVVKINF